MVIKNRSKQELSKEKEQLQISIEEYNRLQQEADTKQMQEKWEQKKENAIKRVDEITQKLNE